MKRILPVLILLSSPLSFADSFVFRNVTVFDGRSETTLTSATVLVMDNAIADVGEGVDVPVDATEIDGKGGFLMPGLIDGHTHLSLIAGPRELQDMHWDEIGAKMAIRAEDTLMRGFTSVRDLGGPVMGLKAAVDDGTVMGPRIYPSGAIISQTSGHGDFRKPRDPHPFLDGGSSQMQELGYYRIVDGPDQVLAAVRENLRNGATQVKLMGSGGVGSDFDPIDSVQFRPEEIRAATQALADWDTYAGSHLHNAAAIKRALENGVMSIDHASQMTDETMKLLKAKGAYMNPQWGWNVFVMQAGFLTDFQRQKAAIVLENIDENIRLIRKHDIEVTFNVDAFGPYELWSGLYAAEFTERRKYFSNLQILRQATSVTAGLLAMSGKRNPYPGKLGVIEEGALADIIIVEGNPLDDITLLSNPEENIALIMKDGKIVKNTLQ
ncbi:MAG: amidohydrolase family protein [Gammaproteobacteria bacterium]|nr:amidohydrolase family protein [Gammaproteobacteria bacterium]